MEEPLIIVSHESSIMVSGEAPRQGRGFLWILGVGTVFFAVALVLAAVFFFQSLVLPAKTVFLLSVRPSAITLSVERREELPVVWQTALASGSRWPVLLGASYKEGALVPFAFVPAWVAPPEATEVVGMGIRRVGGITATSTERIRYGWYLGQKLRLDGRSLDPAFGMATFTTGDGRRWSSDVLVRFSADSIGQPSRSDASIPLFFDRLPDALGFSGADGLLGLLAESSARADVFLPEASSTFGVVFSAGETWKPDQLTRLLTKLGVTGRVSRELPDGSSANFLLPPNVASTTLPFSGQRAALGAFTLEADRFWLNVPTSTALEPATPACPQFQPVARLSSRMVDRLWKGISGVASSASLPAIQIGIAKGKVEVCFE
jgi:hypothetical protein